MPFISFDYLCTKCDRVEERVTRRDEVDTQTCEACGGPLTKQLGAVHFDYRMGVDPDFPTFGDKWARIQRQTADKAKKRQEG